MFISVIYTYVANKGKLIVKHSFALQVDKNLRIA
jgi:hypothetical protein